MSIDFGKLPPKGSTILVSFSGGMTSGFMARAMQLRLRDYFVLVYVFANTGQEREETLEFVHKCDTEFSLNVVWVEAVVSPTVGVGTTHKVVTYETATRGGSLFESMVKKYGIPNTNFPHCTRELKLRPIASYMLGAGGKYYTAIGIRADEYRRVRASAEARNIIYPLAGLWCVDKEIVNTFWSRQQFTLNLSEHEGNCAWCWKKSFKKHFRLISENPGIYDTPMHLEENYALAGPSSHPQVFFRGGKSTKDLFEMATEATGKELGNYLEQSDGCDESCEIYSTQ